MHSGMFQSIQRQMKALEQETATKLATDLGKNQKYHAWDAWSDTLVGPPCIRN